VRILGEVRKEYADIRRETDHIFIDELHNAGLYDEVG
jgi:GMP synthase (glutamine-hydrolysing)